MIERELERIRSYIAEFDNTPGPEPYMRQSDIQNALRPVLSALEAIAERLTRFENRELHRSRYPNP